MLSLPFACVLPAPGRDLPCRGTVSEPWLEESLPFTDTKPNISG